MNEYSKQAADFLKRNNLKFRATYLDTVQSELDPHRYNNVYRCTISGNGRGRVSFKFHDSIANTEANREPEAYDLLACIQKYDPYTFEDFCSEFGYDADSRKAEKTYKAVKAEWRKVEKFFTEAELEQLREIN